jgi:hypothetical protein
MVRGSGWRVGEPACAYFLLICSNDICGNASTSAGKCSGAGVVWRRAWYKRANVANYRRPQQPRAADGGILRGLYGLGCRDYRPPRRRSRRPLG